MWSSIALRQIFPSFGYKINTVDESVLTANELF